MGEQAYNRYIAALLKLARRTFHEHHRVVAPIDPKVVAGEAAFGVATLLWRRIDTMTEPAEMAAHLDTLCAAAAIDRERVRAWNPLRCLDYWLWGLSVGLTEDPRRCARVVDWLGWR